MNKMAMLDFSKTSRSEYYTRWINGRSGDIVMALCWIPFSLLAIAVDDNTTHLQSLMFGVFLFSFFHQPLTMLLVYGDKERFNLRRTLFTWSPLFFVVAVVVSLNINPLILALVAGLWNAEHTLMQRYGITRIYGRMVGQRYGGVEIYMLFSWLIFVLIWVASDPATQDRVATLGLAGTNRRAFELLVDVGSVGGHILPFALATVILIAFKWLLEERSHSCNRAKYLYLASTAALFAAILVHPLAGYIGYVGSHALEYFILVNRSLENGYCRSREGGGALGMAVRWCGRLGFFGIYLASIAVVVWLLETKASVFAYSMVFFTVGALHFFYDGFIWKLRQPKVAKSLGAENAID
jgi:hypothetical protein